MQKLITTTAISYFVMLGTQLIVFSVLVIDVALVDNLIIGAVFTIVSMLLGWKGEWEWTPPASANSSTTETVSTAS